MQPCEKCTMLECLRDERVRLLIEWQIDPNTDRLRTFGPERSSFVRRLRQTQTSAGNDVASHFR